MLTSERAREIQALRTVRRGGRPSRRETIIRAALEAGLPTSEVIDALRQAVLDGKHWAITLWLAYCWGRPGDLLREDDEERGADPAELSDDELAGIVGKSLESAEAVDPAADSPEAGQ